MHIIILGAGIIGISTAWHLLEQGHDVTVVERQPDAALETSFANAAQISVGYCEPWANREAPLKALKWMLSKEAPLLFRPRLSWQQWRWSLLFLGQCNDRAFERNVQQLVALGGYSHAALKDLVESTGISYNRLEKGIAHYYTDTESFDSAGAAAEMMHRYGVERRVISREELLRIEPALGAFAPHIVGGTYTASDESGDAHAFTRALAARCEARGARLLYGYEVNAITPRDGVVDSVTLHPYDHGTNGAQPSPHAEVLRADHVVVACGSYSAPLLRSAGVNLPIYPGKGYSATLRVLKPEAAPQVSLIDDEKKIAISRLGNQLRVAGTIEVGDFDLTLHSPVAQARCEMLSRRIEEVLPGVCDTRSSEDGGSPNYWAGLRPATPTNVPYIGKTPVPGLWVNAGHGTLGWTHGAGSGKALAELISGRQPEMRFNCYGFEAGVV